MELRRRSLAGTGIHLGSVVSLCLCMARSPRTVGQLSGKVGRRPNPGLAVTRLNRGLWQRSAKFGTSWASRLLRWPSSNQTTGIAHGQDCSSSYFGTPRSARARQPFEVAFSRSLTSDSRVPRATARLPYGPFAAAWHQGGRSSLLHAERRGPVASAPPLFPGGLDSPGCIRLHCPLPRKSCAHSAGWPTKWGTGVLLMLMRADCESSHFKSSWNVPLRSWPS
ncbi:hypothetical protein VFPBJ_05957 [Purpureocillium lilacinum]|nr:hypothetical protein VFPBJ_05957 [Purpureocillium lilacinum]